MNQTTKIIITCLLFIVTGIRLCRMLNRNVGPSDIQPEKNEEIKDSIWTAGYKQGINQAIYRKADTMLVLEKQKQLFADCVTERFVRLFPKGLAAEPKDRLTLLSQKAFKSCLAEMPDTAVYKWTPNRENEIRLQLKKGLANSSMPPKVKEKYCNCIVDALHQKYANGIKGEISSKYVKSTALGCAFRAYAKP